MLKIYYFDRSPFCIALLQAARAGGVEPELVRVPNFDRSELIRVTNGASYQVPVLADGSRIVCESGPDSQDLAEYLDTHYLQGRLFPAALQGWQTIINLYIENTVEAVTFKVCDAAVIPQVTDVVERTLLIRHKERKFGHGCVDRWQRERPAMIAEANRLLLPFEQTLLNTKAPFLFGAAPVYTDFLLYGILGNYTFEDTLPFPEELPALRDWRDRVQAFRYESGASQEAAVFASATPSPAAK